LRSSVARAPPRPLNGPTLYRSGALLMDDDRHRLDYASPPKPDPRRKDLFRLGLIGAIFGISYAAFLFWWTLFR
jgi:hypothetical protein